MGLGSHLTWLERCKQDRHKNCIFDLFNRCLNISVKLLIAPSSTAAIEHVRSADDPRVSALCKARRHLL